MLPKHVRYRTALHPVHHASFRDLTNIQHAVEIVNILERNFCFGKQLHACIEKGLVDQSDMMYNMEAMENRIEKTGNYIEKRELLRQEQIAKHICEASIERPRTYHIEAYGCQMNVRDAETLAGLLSQMGFHRSADMQSADMILFHTCCVREHAEKRVFGNIGALREWKNAASGRILAVSGCMMQQREVAEKLFRRFPFVDLVFGTHVMYRLPEMLQSVMEGERIMRLDEENFRMAEGLPALRSNPYSAFVNIMYGCDNFCSYCIVPYVRGRERSRAPKDICQEIDQLAKHGISEITLLGQNVNSYGKGGDGTDFSDLLRMASAIDGVQRIRFMTSHPKDLSEKLVQTMASIEKLCHHVHLPVQSGSDAILHEMNRKYTRAAYLEKVAMLRRYIPDVAITTDIIVGFPGETDQDFEDTLSLVREVGFSSAFTFKYSPRKGTRAASVACQVPEQTKKQRLSVLNALQQDMTEREHARLLGSSGVILVEGYEEKQADTVYGKLSNLKMVYAHGGQELIGTYQRVTITECKRNSLVGRIE